MSVVILSVLISMLFWVELTGFEKSITWMYRSKLNGSAKLFEVPYVLSILAMSPPTAYFTNPPLAYILFSYEATICSRWCVNTWNSVKRKWVEMNKKKEKKSLAKFCMNHTPEAPDGAHFRPVHVISSVGPVCRVSSQMATKQEGERAISKGEGSSQDLRKTEPH